MRARFFEPAFYVALRERGTQERPLHQIMPAIGVALFSEKLVPGRKRGPDRAAGIACRRLHPDVREGAVTQDLAVGDAIERHTARQAEIVEAMLALERARQPQHHLLGHFLDRGCDIHMKWSEQ